MFSVITCAPSPWYVPARAGTNASCFGFAGSEMSTEKKPPRLQVDSDHEFT